MLLPNIISIFCGNVIYDRFQRCDSVFCFSNFRFKEWKLCVSRIFQKRKLLQKFFRNTSTDVLLFFFLGLLLNSCICRMLHQCYSWFSNFSLLKSEKKSSKNTCITGFYLSRLLNFPAEEVRVKEIKYVNLKF